MKIKIKLVATPDKPLSEEMCNQLDDLDNKCLGYIYPKKGSYWWVARNEDSKIVGFCGLKPMTGYYKEMGFLCRAGVLPEAFGNKLQRRFVKVRVRKAVQLGLKEVITYTDRYNYKCISNMIKCGLRFYSPRSEYAGSSSVYFRMKID